MDAKLTFRNLYKVSGAEPERAPALLKEGKDKDAIYAETGPVVGVQA